jgi:DNA-directed RNA polymerase subunit RPC12/RpoP
MALDLSQFTRGSKKDPVPGTVEKETDLTCPACLTRKLLKLKACCGMEKGGLQCRCGYKELFK